MNYGPFTKTNAYTYYPNGLKESFTGPDGVAVTYTYDANNQFTGAQIPGVGAVSVGDYKWNRPASITLPGGVTKELAYDPLMRVRQITATDPAKSPEENKVLDYQYDYDNMDNMTTKTTEDGSYGYGYDDLYRLTEADNPDGTGLSDEAFTYDNVGNRLTSADAPGPWAYNGNNALTARGDVTYEYDANGNMTKKVVAGVVTRFVYNMEDRLSQVWSGEAGSGDLVAEYYYDPFGRRLWKQVGAVRTVFHYSDQGLIAEYDGAGNEIKTYGYKPDSLWTTDPLFMKTGGRYYFYHNDHLGTPQKMTDVSGAVVWSAKSESFGEAVVEVATVENNLRFPGQYFDAETGLHYNWFRYYDPNTGRYLTADPIGFLGGDANLYAYCLSNPIYWLDPFGLHWTNTVANVSAGIGDALLLGYGDELRAVYDNAFSLNGSAAVDRLSTQYRYTYITTTIGTLFVGGTGRLTYATSAKVISYTAKTAEEAVEARNALKILFRLGLNKTYRIKTVEEMFMKYRTVEEIIKATGRTSKFWNGVGIAAITRASYMINDLPECIGDEK